ncbi:Microtubule plus-end tracking protein TIP150 [Pteropus alecto]|uniref:Microtubule plus-end tracking protein TIP150 n=1 Tax=Pteropus alecto TaxID=9402 RepID=L5L6Q6_PTEAL|nr:Microtubule plus-end tracking protein TIP150 [Pteropus alecto]
MWTQLRYPRGGQTSDAIDGDHDANPSGFLGLESASKPDINLPRSRLGSTFGNEDPPALKTALPAKDAPKGASRAAPPAPPSVTTPRRSLLPAPKSTSTPAGYPKQRSGVPRNGFSPKPDLQAREAERQLVQRLKERSERQARQLGLAQRELGRAVCGFQALAVATQHFFRKVEDITASHEAALLEMENSHTEAIATLQGDHDRKVQELVSAHELEKKELEENFERLRLSLQAEKNILLEEKIQILQQQNEDLKARIDQNTVVTRQLSEENANLQEYVEKEAQEKKRLSRTNEELLWKLQTGDPTSPIKLSPTSPVYRGSSSGPSSPAKFSTTPR